MFDKEKDLPVLLDEFVTGMLRVTDLMGESLDVLPKLCYTKDADDDVELPRLREAYAQVPLWADIKRYYYYASQGRIYPPYGAQELNLRGYRLVELLKTAMAGDSTPSYLWGTMQSLAQARYRLDHAPYLDVKEVALLGMVNPLTVRRDIERGRLRQVDHDIHKVLSGSARNWLFGCPGFRGTDIATDTDIRGF